MDEIHHAIARGDLAKVKQLVEAEPDLLYLDDFDACTPLVLSVLAGSLPLVRFFVEEGKADVDEAIPPDGCSALFYACRDGKPDIVRYLLSKGADPCQRNRYATTLAMITASTGASASTTAAAEVSQDASPAVRVLGLLVDAVPGGWEAKAALLDARNRNGKTALYMATERRWPDVVAFFLAAGANPNLMPHGVHHHAYAADGGDEEEAEQEDGEWDEARRAIAGLLREARREPQRVALLEKARRLADAAHGLDKVLATAATGGDDLRPRLLAATPEELRPRVAQAAGAGSVVEAAAVRRVIPKVELSPEEKDKGGRPRPLGPTLEFVVHGGLKPELFVELMGFMSFPWHFAQAGGGQG